MVHVGNLIVIDQTEPWLLELDARDLEELLELPPAGRLGHIMELNRTARYGNRLNAIALMDRLAEVSRENADPPGNNEVPSDERFHRP